MKFFIVEFCGWNVISIVLDGGDVLFILVVFEFKGVCVFYRLRIVVCKWCYDKFIVIYIFVYKRLLGIG